MVTTSGDLAISLIPGISMDANGDQHAFIQMIDGTSGVTYYERYEFDEFVPNPDKLEVNVGNSYFSEEKVIIDLPFIKGEVSISDRTPWPSQLGAPGVMGWYSFVPFMQCYHGVVSMHHRLDGKLIYNDQEYIYESAIGYIEKDWGTSFPKCWIWMHSNHFGKIKRKVSLMASVAHIPWLGQYFVGFLVGLWVDDTLYQFTTYNGSKRTTAMDDDHVYIHLKKGKLQLSIKALKAETAELISPITGDMVGKVNESLSAEISIKLSRGNEVIYEGVGAHSGLEVAGEVEILMA